MPFHATVLYPNDDDITFDMDYYLSKHMPLVQEKFGPHGLRRWEITEYGPGGDGAKPAYHVQAMLVFDSQEDLGKALGSEDAKPVFADIPNFTNKQPVLMGGNVVGKT
ncbi:uncharacterized protein A1O9_10184 [Exophiala aquamarina CBS 119918]|uniref:EthD domain-containing protein n=1 Tax=Exophiala aquamarina CBS 119918 TaxID=1182545 RepID=A0A072P3G5_9EURO|nr:uncharacterized protein A1O9_10184 [Exophiala aquamarina CBS 119918]KEF53783.1 hypothetical protein A1O9_10184 [Exophiala aquamarina CBS 119918]